MRPLTEEEVNVCLEALGLRENLIARLAIFEGMRPGEILALRWKSIEGQLIRIEERVYKRKPNTPKNGKKREGAISDGTLELLNEWADLSRSTGRGRLRIPIGALETVGLGWALFQVLRKTNASLSKKAVVDPKVASDHRGHGLGVSMEVYTSSDFEQKRAAVNRLEAAVLRKPKPVSGEI